MAKRRSCKRYCSITYTIFNNNNRYCSRFVATDTAKLYAVWQDYYLTRKYDLDFSNDTLGTFKVNASVSQNKLVTATSLIEPNVRTVYETKTIYKVPTIQFYSILGSSIDFRTNKIQLGIDLKQKYLIGASGIRIGNEMGTLLI